MKKVLLIAAALVMAASPVWADNITLSPGASINNNNPVANASAAAAASSSSSSSATAVNNITNVNSQGQHQSQGQGQYQGQGQGQFQGQNNKQTISPSQDVHIKAEPLIPGSAPSPGLTSVGTYACLGSISFGLSGPLAGASFGITKVDKGCEHARDAVILMQWGYKEAALKLLTMNEDTAKAVGVAPAVKTSAVAPAGAVPLAALTGQDQAETTSACGKGMVVTPSGFCRWAK